MRILSKVSYPSEWLPQATRTIASVLAANAATKTLCLWRGRATACRTLEPQTAVCLPKLENNGFLRE